MNNEIKRTPGKWEVGYGKGVTGGTCPSVQGATVDESIARSNGDLDAIHHAIVTVPDISLHGIVCSSVVAILPARDGQEKANAHLIAAAPDLLNACELIRQWLKGQMPFIKSAMAEGACPPYALEMEEIEYAIAKAKGDVR